MTSALIGLGGVILLRGRSTSEKLETVMLDVAMIKATLEANAAAALANADAAEENRAIVAGRLSSLEKTLMRTRSD